MMVLGTIRLICACADYINTFLEASRTLPISSRMVGDFVQDNHPVLVLCASWPLLVALALRRTRWPQLLPAAALTFLFLSIGGAVESTAEWRYAQAEGETIGSFHVTRRAFLNPTFADMALIFLGAVQLVLELATAVHGLFLAAVFRGSATAVHTRQDRSRQARWGRLAVYASIAYLFLMVRLPMWSTYIEILNNSSIFREFVIQNDMSRIRGTGGASPYSRRDERLQRTRGLMATALQATVVGQFGLAKKSYTGVIALADSAPKGPASYPYHGIVAEALNNLAWLQATCPDIAAREPAESVKNARRATDLDPANGNFWNTLGAACYRNGNWAEADRAFSQSMQLRRGGDSFDWFFLGLVQLKLGHKDEGLRWYDKAVEWYHRFQPGNQELYRFQVETAQALGLDAPPPPRASAKALFPRGRPRGSSAPPVYDRSPRQFPASRRHAG
jgi:tetratricopeptide (TPR) repeat protein